MNRHVRAHGLHGEQVLHAEEIAPGEWRAVDVERSAGLSAYNREALITRIADLTGAGLVYQLQAGDRLPLVIDRAGNVWLEGEYLSPREYLPRVIPA